MNKWRVIVMATALLLVPGRVYADITAFIGTNTSPSNRFARGFALGMGVLLLGFEFEYAANSEDEEALAPSLRTGNANILLQTPFEVYGFQPYVTAGAGLYRERLDVIDHQETNFMMNTGGGVKVALIGPLRLRVDYRFLRLAGGALEPRAHRIYAGLNMRF